jgi:hypothetical protein
MSGRRAGDDGLLLPKAAGIATAGHGDEQMTSGLSSVEHVVMLMLENAAYGAYMHRHSRVLQA